MDMMPKADSGVADMTGADDMAVPSTTFTIPGCCNSATVTLASFYNSIINNNCAVASFYRAGATLSTMGPNDMTLFRTNIVGVSAQRSGVPNLQYIKANDLDNSFLLYKVTNQQGKVQFGGGSMPSGLPLLNAADQCTRVNWVRSGAT